jgi:predicted dehydrogenase
VGLGNYAKTTVLPHVRTWLDVTCAHELDPLQIPRQERSMAFDTAPAPRAGARYDAYLIAGYHASHAALAARALSEGAAAVIEKPIATDERQLAELLAAIGEPSRAFVCFQRRYHPFNAFVKRDLGLAAGDPVDYHATVYEEPLPAHHWYRWPASGTRLLSNGCHWLDHFLWLNDYAPPVASDLAVSRAGAVNCSVELANGAFMTLVLTDRGSRRIGVREHCELRAGGVTATIRDGRHYRAEDGARVLRRARCDKHEPYRLMYRDVARRIAEGGPGDPAATIEASARLALDLDARLRRLSSRQ